LSVNRGAYNQFENSIYDCIVGGSTAALSWTFTYESTLKTKPKSVKYVADYTGGSCVDTYQIFTN
jgi:hypothetical protein